MTRILAIAAAAVAVAFLLVIYALPQLATTPEDRFAQCRASTVAGGGSIGGPFTLVDQHGVEVTDRDVIDRPTLIYFGYTFCPDVCPLDTVRNADAVDILQERGREVKPVFISVDPGRDTPEVLAAFAENLHPRMVALGGSEEQVRAASRAYRTFYQKQEPEPGSEDYYLIDHSTFSYLMMPDQGFVEFFRRDLGAEQLADAIQCFVDAM